MVQVIDKRGSLFGQIGRGFGQGLSEQLPKEIENYRLRSGLQNLANEADRGQLSPAQFLAKAAGTYGATPQMVQSFGELAKQQARSQSFNQLNGQPNQQTPTPFPEINSKNVPSESNIPSLTTEETTKRAQQGYIPPTQQNQLSRAQQRYKGNEAFFHNDPNEAIQQVQNEDLQEEKIAQAFQTKHTNLTKLQDNVVSRLQNHANQLKATAHVPANVYSDVEDEAIQATKPKSEGGKGLTEQQAIKEYGEKLDNIARDYNAIKTIGSWNVLSRSPFENKRELNSIRESFKARDDLENFADSLISEGNLSPSKAYYLAYKPSDHKELNNYLEKLPQLRETKTEDSAYETRNIAPKLAEIMKKTGASPLAIAEELKSKDYDPDEWLDYITKNKKKLDLKGSQGRQLDKPRNWYSTLNDMWLFMFSGLEKLVEQ